MAATKVKKSDSGQGFGNGAGGFRNRLPDMPNVVDKSPSSGYLFVLVLFAFVFVMMLPLVGMMLVDTMVVKREAKAQMEKVEKLRKSVEEAQKKEEK